MHKTSYTCTGSLWLYPGHAGWVFFTISKKTTSEIDTAHKAKKKGWGSLPVKATIGKTIWETSIFPDKKSGTYLLPIKKAVRKTEELEVGDKVSVDLKINL